QWSELWAKPRNLSKVLELKARQVLQGYALGDHSHDVRSLLGFERAALQPDSRSSVPLYEPRARGCADDAALRDHAQQGRGAAVRADRPWQDDDQPQAPGVARSDPGQYGADRQPDPH